MALEITTKFSVDLSEIVENSITAVRAVRKNEQARKEVEFQKAVAIGMSYKDQVAFRETQLEEEKKSSIFDSDYIGSLEKSIADTKKLARFETIRIKYKKSLDDYITGKESISQHIQVLEDILGAEQDPEKQQEIRDLLSNSHKEQNNIEVNAIKNRSILAQKDTSIPLIDASISDVQSKRALAAINKNDDEVAAWDDTLLSLRSAKSKLLIENGLNEITYQTNRSNLQSGEKLNLYNNYVSGADASNPVIYGGITYPSLKAYWENKRGEYLSNNYFDDVKKEMDAQTEMIATTNKYGQVPVARIQAVNDFYNALKNKSEFAPYVEQIEQKRLESVIKMANTLYTSLIDEANTVEGTQNFSNAKAKAESAILGIENRFGIKIARPAFDAEMAKNKTIADTTIKETATPTTPVIPTASVASTITPEGLHIITDPVTLKQYSRDFNVPGSTYTPYTASVKSKVTPTPVVTPTSSQVQPAPTNPPVAVPKVHIVKPGETLSAIAQRELGDASKWKDLKTESGQSYDEETAKKLQIGTKLIIPTL